MNIIATNSGNYQNLTVYQKTECIYDITFYFVNKYLSKGDRTIDQMLQSARSGKQNIAEGAAASITSRQTELKLTNVARASLQELLIDYQDYLRTRGLCQWDKNSGKAIQARRVCAAHNDSAFYRDAIASRSDETIANIAITLIYQADLMLRKLLKSIEQRFLAEGGIRERMTRARIEARNNSGKE